MRVIYHAERENPPRKGRRYFDRYYLDPGMNEMVEEFKSFLEELAEKDAEVAYFLKDRVIVFEDVKEEVEAPKPQVKKLSKKDSIPVIDE